MPPMAEAEPVQMPMLCCLIPFGCYGPCNQGGGTEEMAMNGRRLSCIVPLLVVAGGLFTAAPAIASQSMATLAAKVNLRASDLPGWKVLNTANASAASSPATFDKAFYRCIGLPAAPGISLTEPSQVFYTGHLVSFGFRTVQSFVGFMAEPTAATGFMAALGSSNITPRWNQYLKRSFTISEPGVAEVSTKVRGLAIPGAPPRPAAFQVVISFGHKKGPPTEDTSDAVYFAVGRSIVVLGAEAFSLGVGGPSLPLVGHLTTILVGRAEAVRAQLG
jgi:hypothetical protein